DSPALNLGNTGTIEAWVNPSSLGRWHGVIAKGAVNSDLAHNYALEIQPGNHARCILGNGLASQFLDSTTTLSAGQFRHVACTWDVTGISIYIDATLDVSTPLLLTPG